MVQPRLTKSGDLPTRQLYRRKRVTLRDASEEAEPSAKHLKPETNPDPSTDLEGDGDQYLNPDCPDNAGSVTACSPYLLCLPLQC